MQKFGSTRNKIGLVYSRYFKELYVRRVFVSKFHISVVTLKIQNQLWQKALNSGEISLNSFLGTEPHAEHICLQAFKSVRHFVFNLTDLPSAYWGSPPMIKYSSLYKIADGLLLISFKSPILFHSLFWNWAMVDVLLLP